MSLEIGISNMNNCLKCMIDKTSKRLVSRNYTSPQKVLKMNAEIILNHGNCEFLKTIVSGLYSKAIRRYIPSKLCLNAKHLRVRINMVRAGEKAQRLGMSDA